MLYSMWQKRKLAMIVEKVQSRRYAKNRCIFKLSCPELDAIRGPPRCKPGMIIVHPLHALQVITKGLKIAKKAKDRRTMRILKGLRVHVQTIIDILEVYYKLGLDKLDKD